ncbi:L-xylulose 5-phosphate 3-epimerase [Listeria floridensis FSL S10-1187]|uniref:L-ribulose-5-phosphate 3-epimerase n=1 Tax=Listeria floridensis FSL S10-1187 TaxID=1265817 RepID=A0ABN0RER3_9LIST|nr:L-ribulose-5-phosphate 3-epimerase [Listeria floridensis]EUJ31669.1 L-xylulose 5-phosphate 3-epimerase [Listeria floridensis FSL S10-1187]
MKKQPLGIYEKALPKSFSWEEKFKLARQSHFDFIELSIDESDERLARLDWTASERATLRALSLASGIRIPSMCLSGHRRYPLGSLDPAIRETGLLLMQKAIDLASDLGIRVIQLAGYDVYYESKSLLTRAWFIENLQRSLEWAAAKQVILAIEIMDDPFMSSVTKYLHLKAEIGASPWLKLYPDIGNLSAWPENDLGFELAEGISDTVAIHLKDTLPVTTDFPGKFKEVPFGSGCVDFAGAFKTLQQLGYAGPYLIEMWGEQSPNCEAELAAAKNFIETKWKEAEIK